MAIPSKHPVNSHSFSWAFPVQNWKKQDKIIKNAYYLPRKVENTRINDSFHIISTRAYACMRTVKWYQIFSFQFSIKKTAKTRRKCADFKLLQAHFMKRTKRAWSDVLYFVQNANCKSKSDVLYFSHTKRNTSPTGGGRHENRRHTGGGSSGLYFENWT